MQQTANTHYKLGTKVADAFWLAGGVGFWIGVVLAAASFVAVALLPSDETSALAVAIWPLLLIAAFFFGLGLMVRYGLRGIALKKYRNAAEQGDARAQCALAERYDDGVGVPKDYSTAANFYLEAAERGVADAQYEVGARYETGVGLSQDYTQAIEWYRRAAEQGDGLAQQRLAKIHEMGRDGAIGDETAAYWHQRLTQKRPERRKSGKRLIAEGAVFLAVAPILILISLTEYFTTFHNSGDIYIYIGLGFGIITFTVLYYLLYLLSVFFILERLKFIVRLFLATTLISFPRLVRLIDSF